MTFLYRYVLYWACLMLLALALGVLVGCDIVVVSGVENVNVTAECGVEKQ